MLLALHKICGVIIIIDVYLVRHGFPERRLRKAKVTFALRRGHGGRTPSELTETCGGRRSVSEVASGWPYVVWLYFTGRRVAVEL